MLAAESGWGRRRWQGLDASGRIWQFLDLCAARELVLPVERATAKEALDSLTPEKLLPVAEQRIAAGLRHWQGLWPPRRTMGS